MRRRANAHLARKRSPKSTRANPGSGKKGVAFFAAKGQFNAFSQEGKERSTVAGDWETFDDGRMCFSGLWTASSWRRFVRTCFAHKIKDGQIYQRRLPKGEWYVFRHEPAQAEDQKLVSGDQTR